MYQFRPHDEPERADLGCVLIYAAAGLLMIVAIVLFSCTGGTP